MFATTQLCATATVKTGRRQDRYNVEDDPEMQGFRYACQFSRAKEARESRASLAPSATRTDEHTVGMLGR